MTARPVRFPVHELDRELRAGAAAVCARYPLEYWARLEESAEFPEDFRRDFVGAGFASILIPEEYGGGGGTMREQSAAMEEVAAGGGGLNATAAVHIPLLCVPALLRHGTPEQRDRLLPAIASGELFVSFGVTEPDTGTDTTRIATRARRTADGWTITGRKVWNSGALRADAVLLLVRTSAGGARKGDGLSLLLAPLRGDTVTITPIPKIGRRAVASCELVFSDHVVAEDAVVGTADAGFYHLLAGLNAERLLLAAESIGLGRWALEAAGRYARERVVFDRPIGQNQAVAHPLARAYVQLLAASEVTLRGLTLYDDDGAAAGPLGTIANAAKYLATEAAWACTEAAMQTFGGYAFAREYHIGRYWTETRLGRLAPVNNEMVLNYIAERELDLPRSY